jgi:hypothetical protein
MNNKKQMAQAEKDLRTAQKELFDIVTTCTVFLNKNGMSLDYICELLHETVDDSFNQTTIALESERLK